MGKYDRISRQTAPRPRPWAVHPIWRGIGCILFLIGPVIAYLTADLLVQLNMDRGLYPVPRELAKSVTLPLVDLTVRHLYANMMVTALLLLLGFAVIMVVYAIIYAVFGPKRYGPLDAPPIRRKIKPSR